MRKTILAFTFILIFTQAAVAQSKSAIRSLRGIKGVTVFIIKPLNVKDHGVDSQQLTTDVESKLSKAGIKVQSIEESNQTPGQPAIFVIVELVKAEAIHFVSIRLQLKQTVQLSRDLSLIAAPATWEVSNLLIKSTDKLPEIRDAIGEAVNSFIKDYISANPPSGPK